MWLYFSSTVHFVLVGPGIVSPSGTSVVLGVLVTDFPFPKALSFLNRS